MGDKYLNKYDKNNKFSSVYHNLNSSRNKTQRRLVDNREKTQDKKREKFTFKAKIPELEDQPTIEIYKLNKNDTKFAIEWKDKILRAKDLCDWNEIQAVKILKLVTD